MVVVSGSLGGEIVTAAVCTDLLGKEPHKHVGVGWRVTSMSLGGVWVTVGVCGDLSGKEPHRQVAVDRVVTTESLSGTMVSTLNWNERDVGSIPPLGAIFPIFIVPRYCLP